MRASVLIRKFLRSFTVEVEGSAAESFDRGKDVVCGLCPAEGSGVTVAGFDVALDGIFEFLG